MNPRLSGDSVFYWIGGTERGSWHRIAAPGPGAIATTLAALARSGHYAVPGRASIGAPDGPPREPGWFPGFLSRFQRPPGHAAP